MKKLSNCLLVLSLVFCVSCSKSDARHEQYLTNARALVNQGDFASAKLEFNNALREQHENIEALYGLAGILEREGNWPRMREFLDRVIQLEPSHVPARVKRAFLYASSGHFDVALQHSDELVELAPDIPDVWLLKASLQMHFDNYKGARNSLDTAVKLEADTARSTLLMANLALMEGNENEALLVLDKGIEQSANDVLLYVLKIKALNRLGKQQEVLSTFETLISKQPANAGIRKALAEQFVAMKDLESAEEVLVLFANSYPTEESFINVIDFLKTYASNERVVTEIRNYISVYPEIYNLRLSLADYFLVRKEFDQARSVLLEGMASTSDTTNILQSKNQLAVVELVSGRADEAFNLVNEILNSDPGNTKAITTQARIVMRDGKLEKAIRLLRSALHNNTNDPFVQFLLAEAHNDNGDVDLAHDHYQRAFALARHNNKFAIAYARFLLRNMKLEEAERVLESVSLRRDYAVELLELLAQVKLHLRKWQDAENIARKLEKLQADPSVYAHILGESYNGRDMMEESITSYYQAFSSSPKALKPLYVLVSRLLNSGRSKEAHTVLQDVLRNDDKNLNALLLQSLVFVNQGNIKQAEESLLVALKVHPDSEEVYRTSYDFYRRQGMLDKARDVLQLGVTRLPNNMNLSIKYAENLMREQLFDEAIAVYRRWLDVHPETYLVQNNLANLLLQKGQADATTQALALVQSLKTSKVPHFQHTVGWAYLSSGQPEISLEYFKQAHGLLPEYPQIEYHLALAYHRTNDSATALGHLQSAVGLADKQGIDEKWLPAAKQLLAQLAERVPVGA